MNLQKRREDVGFTQADLAAAAGITRTALSLIENGRLSPSEETRHAIERALDPFHSPVRLVYPDGPLSAAELLRSTSMGTGLEYALTLDVASWMLTGYQTPATAWAYARPLERWSSILRSHGVRPAARLQRANLVLLRASDEILAGVHLVDGYRLVSHRRLIEDCARLGGRHNLDGARLFVAFPDARVPGLRLDADSLLKVFEEVVTRT